MILAKIRENPLKIVTVCHGGNVRSVGLKFLLRYKYGHDAVALGTDGNSQEIKDILFGWADYIVLLEPSMEDVVEEEFKTKGDGSRKLFCYNVGPDRFGYAFHPELISILDTKIKEHGLFNTEIL